MSRSTQHHRPSLVRRIGGACVLAAALLLIPLPASGGIAWDVGIATGYVALVVAATLYLYPLRGEGLPHRRLFTLSQHRRLGWTVLVLGLLHGAILLVAQPLIGHYLLPSAPLFMLLGLAALVALGVLVATGLAARSALRSAFSRRAPPSPAVASATGSAPDALPRKPQTPGATPPASVTTHAVLAAFLLTLVGAHILGSHQLADKSAKATTLCVLLALPLVWAALRGIRSRQTGAAVPRTGAPARRAPARLLPTLVPNFAAAAILFLLPIPTATPHLLQQAATPSVLPAYLPHEKHTTVECVTCHHNFVDATGMGSCLDCHRSDRSDLPQSAEATFHTFCRSCHTELAEASAKHGPTRACSQCHIKDRPTGSPFPY